jgi:uncharacterized protein YndB with AHSA1/START domain
MPREFELHFEAPVDATPDEIWTAISTGPGTDSWFMGRSEFEAREGGRGTFQMGGYAIGSTVTAYEPGRRFAYRSDEGEDGRFMAFEFLIEGRDQGSTTVRLVHSGFLGADWEDEYEAMSRGDAMYFHKLVTYLTHFAGRIAAYNMFLLQPAGLDQAWVALRRVAGLGEEVAEGDKALIQVPGLPPTPGVVDYVRPEMLGIRTDAGMHRFLHSQNTLVAEYHDYAGELDPETVERSWKDWLATI